MYKYSIEEEECAYNSENANNLSSGMIQVIVVRVRRAQGTGHLFTDGN